MYLPKEKSPHRENKIIVRDEDGLAVAVAPY